MIRPAKFADIPRMVEILKEIHLRSIYADWGEIDLPETKRLLLHSIQRHGHLNAGGTLAMVAEKDNQVEGLIIGVLDRIYGIGTKLYATDLFFVATPLVDPRDPPRLVDALIAWAKQAPLCRQITMGVTTAAGDPKRTGKILARKGLRPSGEMYSMEVSR